MFAPEEFIHLARELARRKQSGGSEAARARTAHGRLYYGLFLTIRSILVHRHGLPSHTVKHGDLYRHLQHSTIQGALRELGRELEWLYSLRQKADYDLALSRGWQGKVENADFAAVAAARALALAQNVPQLDFAPIIPLFF